MAVESKLEDNIEVGVAKGALVKKDEDVILRKEAILIANGFKKIEEQNYIDNLFRNLARKKEVSILIDFNSEHIAAQLLFLDLKANQLIVKDGSKELKSENNIRISLIYKDELLFFESKILKVIDNTTYQISKPDTIYSSIRRLISRYRVKKNEDLTIQFVGENSIYPIYDITTKGLSFKSKNIVFSERSAIKTLKININGTIIFVDGKLLYCKKQKDDSYLHGISFQNLQWPDYNFLFSYIFSNEYPHLKNFTDFSSEEVYELFRKSGYLDLKTKEEMHEAFHDFIKNIVIIKDKPEISINPIFYKEGKPLSTASLLRIYNHTFLGHQLAAVPESRLVSKSKSDIYLGFADILLSHPYFKYYLSYILDLPWHQEMFKKIGEIINDKNKFLLDSLHYYECNIIEYCNNTDKYVWNNNCEIVENEKEFIEFIQSESKEIIVNSYSYTTQDFSLLEIKQVYQLLGLYIDRKLWRIKKGKKVIAYIVAEAYSSGLNLFNVLDMCRIYFRESITSNLDYIIHEMMPHIVAFYQIYKKKKFNIMFKCLNEELPSINFIGINYKYQFGRVIISKEGVAEYKKFLSITLR